MEGCVLERLVSGVGFIFDQDLFLTKKGIVESLSLLFHKKTKKLMVSFGFICFFCFIWKKKQMKPNETNETKWNQMKPNETKWNQMKPNETKWNQMKQLVLLVFY